jgi:L-aspartate oxidase
MVREHTLLIDFVVDAGRVVGVQLLDADGIHTLAVDAVVLASGGAGQLYRHTTNPTVTTGDGVAAAFRAGAVLADLEMFQFHPTALAVPGSFLISEAVRGEGAVLIDQSGHQFMRDIDERGELAPRDVVARGIQQTMMRQGGQPVLLDATGLGDAYLAERFPAITKACRSYGLNWGREPIPVTPAAHYWMGGVATDTSGRTSITGLFAVGEVACTGAHGANRLASNSLLEAVVFAERAVQSLGSVWPDDAPDSRWHERGPLAQLDLGDESGTDVVDRIELQTMMWDSVGLARTAVTLDAALHQCMSWRPASSTHRVFSDWEDANLLQLASIVTASALAREESRGAHYRLDFPQLQQDANRPITVIRKTNHA